MLFLIICSFIKKKMCFSSMKKITGLKKRKHEKNEVVKKHGTNRGLVEAFILYNRINKL